MDERVTVAIDQGVADVRLNRPDKLNALDTDMFVGLVEAGARLAAEPSVRAVVLSGQGRAFSAGLDFSGFTAMARGRASGDGGPNGSEGSRVPAVGATDGRITHLAQQAAHCWSEVPAPVIAAIWGHCLGGGLQIALGADLRIVHPDATLAVLEIRWGLSPDMSGTATLPRLVGPDVAKELAWTGRAISGQEAARIGLATRASDTPLEDAQALARELASKSPQALRGVKRLIDQSGRVPLAQQYADEREVIGSLVGTPNQVEAVTAYFEKREPNFADPG
jgi:enoyl-CoA hydratase/carnithine racemase